MSGKLRHEKTEYFKVPAEMLVGGKGIDFPLYIHLEKNQSMILRFNESVVPFQEQVDAYRKKGLKYFACPDTFYPRWLEYLKSISESAHDAFVKERFDQAAEFVSNAVELDVAKKAMSREGMSQEDKKNILSNLGEKMVGIMNDFAGEDPEKRQSAYKECQKMTDDVVAVALQSHKMKSVFDDLVMMREAGIEHSSAVSTVAVIFALTIGFVDEEGLGEISLGGMLHDIGQSRLPLEVFEKPHSVLESDEQKTFYRHAAQGVELIDDIGEDVPGIVKFILSQHHEKYDGTGYPNGLSGFQLDERVQIVGLADHVDDLMSGRATGEKLNPVEAFQWLRDRQNSKDKCLIVSPEIFEAVYQVVMNSKPTDLGKMK